MGVRVLYCHRLTLNKTTNNKTRTAGVNLCMRSDWCRFVFTALLLYGFKPCYGQFEIAAGPAINFPQIIVNSGKAADAWQLFGGGTFALSYNPKDNHFYTSLRFSPGQTQLPVEQNGSDLGALTFGYFSLMLNGNYSFTVQHTRHLVLYSGIGLLSLREKNIPSSASSSQNLIVSIDSITHVSHVFPGADIGIEYKGKTFGKKFCWSVGLSILYSKLAEGNNIYYLQTAGTGPGITFFHERASLTGDLFQPAAYLVINYRPGKVKSSWYL